uniref:F-box protein n=1 Tax=Kalanchoe fedtschenkoi TaxID=63787 RepID=A0A7N0TR23_KALFE
MAAASESAECHLKSLSRDLLVDVMGRLDGLSLAAAACTCTELQDVATQERGLWESLCQATWPSTASPDATHLVPFPKFYADSHPLILYDGDSVSKRGRSKLQSESLPEDLVSLVDVYYKGECVLSKVIDGIPEAWNGGGGEHQKWFADCPFELDVVKFDYSQGMRVEDEVDAAEEDEGGDFSKELQDDIRMSWILLNKKTQKSVNLSSWKPLTVQKSWISNNNYTLQFGCVVPVDDGLLPQGLAECVITARCERTKEEGSSKSGLKWEEIGMSIKDMVGAHLGGKKSLVVLHQALYCPRSNNQEEVQKGYARFERKKKEMKRARDYKETLANGLCLSVEIIIFATLYHTFFL